MTVAKPIKTDRIISDGEKAKNSEIVVGSKLLAVVVVKNSLVSKVQTFCRWNSTPIPTKQAGFKLLSSLLY